MKLVETRFLFCVFLLFALIVSCSNSEQVDEVLPEDVPEDESARDTVADTTSVDTTVTDTSGTEPERIDPFVKPLFGYVAASGDSVVVGTDDPAAEAVSRPSFDSKFTYDFEMSYREVTFREYLSVFGNVPDSSYADKPAYNVTFYDGVLYANALSKKLGLDTVYVYSGAVFDKLGSCLSLLNFSTLYEVDGYRLPTEAEWIYVAGKNWERSCADASDEEFCGFADGVKEWANDWMGSFRDTSVVNYVGMSNGGPSNGRVLKGGSDRDDPSKVKIYGRRDVYPVTSDFRADYVGFRVVRGAISEYTATDIYGRASTSIIRVSLDGNALRKLGTSRSKIAFRNDVTGNLVFVDFVSGSYVPHEIVDVMDVYHPEISPDGKFVAFCTRPEGVSGESDLYVRKLDPYFSSVWKFRQGHGAIPRWRVLDNGDTAIVYVTSAANNKDDADFMGASTHQVIFSNGFGRDEKLFDGAYHGGVSDGDRLAVSGARIFRARTSGQSGYSDTVWYGGEQACNVSLARDGSGRSLFLDFGGNTGREFAGSRYGTHEMLLVVDSLGKLVQGVPAPAGYSFDHTEWIPGRNMAVATLVDGNGVHGKIVLVDFSDSTVSDIVSGEELGYPSLWAYGDIPSDGGDALDRDSAGVYMFSGSGYEMSLYRYKLELLWRYRDSADAVVMGSSRSLSGIDPECITSHLAINLSQTPSSMYVVRDFFERYVLGNVRKIKYLVLSLDLDLWWKRDVPEENFFIESYRAYPGFVYDENHGYWKDDRSDRILRYTEVAVGTEETDKILYHRGMYVGTFYGWSEDPEILKDSTWNQENPQLFDDNLEVLEKLVQLASKNGITVVGVIFPQNPNYANTGAYGKYGPMRSEAPGLVSRIAALESKYGNFHLVDENRMGAHDYSLGLFENDDHLYKSGAAKLTARLDSLMRVWDAR